MADIAAPLSLSQQTPMQYIKINPADNVAVALADLPCGSTVSPDGREVTLLSDVPAGHKVLLRDLRAGEDVVKYGYPIGHVSADTPAGTWINERNLKTNLSGLLHYDYQPHLVDLPAAGDGGTFEGYLRADGQAGIRNEVWVIPTVGCVNGIVARIVERLREETRCEGVDAIVGFPHNYGCSQLGCDHENTRKVLRDMVHHPNAGAILVVGLGCENNQPDAFRDFCGDYDRSRVRFLVAQQTAGDEVEAGLAILRELYLAARQQRRQTLPLSLLRVGLKCGGSDGFSGITANPLLGRFSDWLVARGGTTVLTEVPEMFGAETILMNRCESRERFDEVVKLINDFKEYFLSHGEPVGENPSPGNKAGGISTLEDKALGCTQKCGTSTVRAVLRYGDRLTKAGLNLLEAPGNDLVAATALAAAGCQLVLFTTGRGTPFGSFVPTMKVSTNSGLAQRKPNWIDFNAGVLAEGREWALVEDDFRQFVVSVASGRAVCNERNGYREIAIFKTGVTL